MSNQLPPTQRDSIRALEHLIDSEQEKARVPPDSPGKGKGKSRTTSAPIRIPPRAAAEASGSVPATLPVNLSGLSLSSGTHGTPTSALSSSLPPDVKMYRSQLQGWADEQDDGHAHAHASKSQQQQHHHHHHHPHHHDVSASSSSRPVSEPLPTPPPAPPVGAAPPLHVSPGPPAPLEAPVSPLLPEPGIASLSLGSAAGPRISAVAGVVTAGTPRLEGAAAATSPGPERKQRIPKAERKAAKREAALAAKAARGAIKGTPGAASAVSARGDDEVSLRSGTSTDAPPSESPSTLSARKSKQSGAGSRQLQQGGGGGKDKDGKDGGKKKATPVAKTRQVQFDDPKARAKVQKNQILRRTAAQRQHPLFSHLPQYERETSLSLDVGFSASEKIHPAVLHLGLKIAEGSIRGGNARCVAMLTAFRTVVRQMQTPSDKILSRELEAALKPMIQFLVDCRPLSISMGNAIKWLKREIASVPPTMSESEQRDTIVEAIDTFINERVIFAGSVIAQYAVEKISDGDVLLTYGCSSSVERVIRRAHELNRRFRVIIVDSRPDYNGKELLRRLVTIGVSCSYCTINAVSYIMSEATKVFLGAASMLSNGSLFSGVGTSLVAMMAHEYNVPVLVCCETYKFCERVQLDSFTSNELKDPDELIHVGKNQEEVLNDWRDLAQLKLLHLAYDVTPMQLIVVVITEVGIIPPTSVPVIIREYRKETQA